MAGWVLPAIMGAAKIGINFLNKPKKPDTAYVNEIIAENRKRMADRGIERNIGQSAQRGVASNVEETRRQSEYRNRRLGTSGSGAEAMENLMISKSANKTLADTASQATLKQNQVNVGSRENIEQAMLVKKQLESQHKQEVDKWKMDFAGIAAETGLSIAGGVIENNQQWAKAEELAKADGFSGNLKDLSKDPSVALKIAGMNVAKQQGVKLFNAIKGTFDDEIQEKLGEYDTNQSQAANMQILQSGYQQAGDAINQEQAGIAVGLLEKQDELTAKDITGSSLNNEWQLKLLPHLPTEEKEKVTTVTSWENNKQVTRIIPQIEDKAGIVKSITEQRPADPKKAVQVKERFTKMRSNVKIDAARLSEIHAGTPEQNTPVQMAKFLSEIENPEFNYARANSALEEYLDSLDIKVPTNGTNYTLETKNGTVTIGLTTGMSEEQAKIKAKDVLRDDFRRLLDSVSGNYAGGEESQNSDLMEWQ